MKEKPCCVTSYGKIAADKIDSAKRKLRREALQAISDGYLHYIMGFEEDIGLSFAEVLLELQKGNPTLSIEAAIPYRNMLLRICKNRKMNKILAQCSEIVVLNEEYCRNCYMNRDRFMVLHSSRVIFISGGQEKSGTAFILREAAVLEHDIRVIEV